MKPFYQFLLAACTLTACTSKDDPNAIQKFSGVCKEKSDQYFTITQNGTSRTSVHDNVGSARIIFLAGTDSMMRVYLFIDSQASQPPIMLNAIVPAASSPGIYHSDSSKLSAERNVQLMVDQKNYYSTDLQLIISSLGTYQNGPYGIREYVEAAGSFSGNFTPDAGGQPIPVSGEFCIDFDGEKK